MYSPVGVLSKRKIKKANGCKTIELPGKTNTSNNIKERERII